MAMILYLDTVALRRDDSSRGLRAGELGTVVEVLEPGVFLVEFADELGRARVIDSFSVDQLRLVQSFEPVSDVKASIEVRSG